MPPIDDDGHIYISNDIGRGISHSSGPSVSYLTDDVIAKADEAYKKAADAEVKLKELDKKILAAQEEALASRNKNLETLAIFVALFTFASLSFQMFANVNKTYWVPLSLILLGGLTLFCSILASISSLKIDETWRRKVMPAVCGVISVGLIMGGSLLYRNALTKQDNNLNQCVTLAQKILGESTNLPQGRALYNLVCSEIK